MIYWDHNATTPCAPEVVAAMQPYWSAEYGNPSSPHLMGRRAAAAIRDAASGFSRLVESESAGDAVQIASDKKAMAAALAFLRFNLRTPLAAKSADGDAGKGVAAP